MTARSDVLFITDKTKLLKSALGQKRRSAVGRTRPVFPHYPDIFSASWHVSNLHRTGSRCLLDHLVGAGEKGRRDFEADRISSLEVDHKIEAGGLVEGNFSRSGAFQNLRNLAGSSAGDVVRKIDRISHQSPDLDEFAI